MVTSNDFTVVLRAVGAGLDLIYPVAELALGANKALDGTVVEAWPAFLATMTQESAYFRTTTEYDNSRTASYDPYRGRTFEQVTHLGNYAAFGEWCKSKGYTAVADLFVQKPHLLAEMQWAWLGGIWYFEYRGLWRYAVQGDFQRVSTAVNLGTPSTTKFPSGWNARLTAYQAWTARLGLAPQIAVNGKMDEATVTRLQQWLGVGMDGDYGSVTRRALEKWLGRGVDGNLSRDDVKALQKAVGALVDGDWGPGTTKALQRFLNGHVSA